MATKDTTIKFRADEESLSKLDYCADNLNKSRSEVIRQGIEDFYEKVQTTPIESTVDETKGKRVVELFAGVGGFHLGFSHTKRGFNTIWANQWEPGKTAQHAFDCYKSHYGDTTVCVCEDVAKVKELIK